MTDRPSLRLRPSFTPDTLVAVYRNYLQCRKERDYVWKIEAREGRWAGRVVGIATEVPLVGPIEFLDGPNPAVLGHISEPIKLTNARHYPKPGAWGHRPPAAIICTSDGELWAVHGGNKLSTSTADTIDTPHQ